MLWPDCLSEEVKATLGVQWLSISDWLLNLRKLERKWRLSSPAFSIVVNFWLEVSLVLKNSSKYIVLSILLHFVLVTVRRCSTESLHEVEVIHDIVKPCIASWLRSTLDS